MQVHITDNVFGGQCSRFGSTSGAIWSFAQRGFRVSEALRKPCGALPSEAVALRNALEAIWSFAQWVGGSVGAGCARVKLVAVDATACV